VGGGVDDPPEDGRARPLKRRDLLTFSRRLAARGPMIGSARDVLALV
jgi:hypothetical protein